MAKVTTESDVLEVRDKSIAHVFWDVQAERIQQDAKWDVQNLSSHEWISVLTEEVGESAEAANILTWGGTTYPQRRKEFLADLRAELVQVAAVAVAAIECLDRNSLLA